MPADELLSRGMPWSAEAEQAVIGSLLINPGCIPEVMSSLHAADFYDERNRDIFDTVYAMFTYSEAVDAVTVLEKMKQLGVFREDSSRRYMADLIDATPTTANVMRYVQIVRDKALLRGIIDLCGKTSEMAMTEQGDADAVLDLTEKSIYALRQDRLSGGLVPVSQIVETVYENIEALSASGSPIPGISTGFSQLDRTIMGLNKSDLILVAARPGMGKTSIGLNMALNAARTSKKTVAIFSLEMSREQLVTRLMSAEGLVNLGSLLTGNMSPDEWRRAAEAAESLSRLDIRISDNPSLTVAEMNAQCRRLPNLGLVMIDYLQLMQGSGSTRTYAGENRTQVVSDISRMMKVMAKELRVPVICLSQLSRANESRQDKRPMLSDLRESGSIEQDADIVLGLYREGYYNQEIDNPNLAECIILKNRHGETGKAYMAWVGDYTIFRDIDNRHDSEY